MDDQPPVTVAVLPSRQTRLAKIGLLGIAAAAFLAVAMLALGAGAAPAGILAANDSTTPATDDGVILGHGGPGGRGGFGLGGITITAISGSELSLRTVDGWTRTITVDSGTTYSKSGATIALSDLKVGDDIRFRQTRESDGSYTIDAVEVVLPRVGGTVTAIDGSTITLLQPDGQSVKVTATSSTSFQVNGSSGALSDVKAGMVLMAEGTKNSDGSLTATEIRAGAMGMAGGHHGPRMFPGRPGGDWDGDAPNASAAPQASGSAS